MSLGKSEGLSVFLSKLFWGSFCCFCQVRKGVEGFPKCIIIIIHKGVFVFAVVLFEKFSVTQSLQKGDH